MPGEPPPPPPQKKSAKLQLAENSSSKFDPPCLLPQACYFRQYVGFREGEAFQKICNALPIRQDIAY
jgi:hypothetical protein